METNETVELWRERLRELSGLFAGGMRRAPSRPLQGAFYDKTGFCILYKRLERQSSQRST